jgi:hypothetical protein
LTLSIRTLPLRAALALALLASACAARDLGTAATPRASGDSPGSVFTPAPAATSAPRAGGPPPTRRTQGGGQTQPGDGGTGEQPAAEGPRDDGAVGDNATVYLRSSVPRLVVEVDAVAGKNPDPGALDHLRTILYSVLSKPSGIDVRPTATIPATSDGYTNNQLQALIDAHRQTHTTSAAASIYVLYVNGGYNEKDGENTLAITFDASDIVVFRDQVQRASRPPSLVSASAIERSVLAHEAGHLLGLVNIGYASPRDHEDRNPKHAPHHSKNPDSVMYWAVEDVNVSRLLEGRTSPPDEFDADDRADLEDRKAGRL